MTTNFPHLTPTTEQKAEFLQHTRGDLILLILELRVSLRQHSELLKVRQTQFDEAIAQRDAARGKS